MYRNKKEVDKYVESLLSKLSVKEFKTRALSIARLYFDVGDYENCRKYVEQYISQKGNNAAAFKLLGQALQKLGQKEKALEQHKAALDLDPTQTTAIIDICELLVDEDVSIDPGRAKFWCEKAEAIFPRHPVTFRLREKLVAVLNPDPEALVNLLMAELAVRPKDVLLHIRLLKHYMHHNQFQNAFEHSCKIEFIDNTFVNNYVWYEILSELLQTYDKNANDWLYQLLLLTVKERICMLSISETSDGSAKSLVESNELLHQYDQAIEVVAKAGPGPGYVEFHAGLLQHHRGQFALHAATFLLKKAKKNQLNWKEAVKLAAPLMMIAWHAGPLDQKVNWLRHAPEKQLNAIKRWYSEATYRCSQSGHYLLTNIQDNSQSFIEQISQCCSGTHWRDKLYEKIFTSRSHLLKIKTSHFVSSAYSMPALRLPRKSEIIAYDYDSQREYGSSLHHFVWTLLNYKSFAQFKCTLFEMLTPSVSACGPETLNSLDFYAFLYCAALTANQQSSLESSILTSNKPKILPANITDLLCPTPQLKWWDCAYKFSQSGLGTELTDIRSTLTRGIETVRCVDNHGLDAELLCILGRIFSEKAQTITNTDEKELMESRAALYYSSAIPLLEKLKNKIIVKIPEKRMFDYTHKNLSTKDIKSLIEESKLFVAVRYLNGGEYDKVVNILSDLKSPQAYFHLSQTYKKLAIEENNISNDGTSENVSKYATLLSKAKSYGYKALDRLKETNVTRSHSLYAEIQDLIEELETRINKLDYDISGNVFNDMGDKYSSDDNVSNDHMPIRSSRQAMRNLSSTPKAQKSNLNVNLTNYRTAIDSHVLETTRVDQQFLERIETEIKILHKSNSTLNDFMEQTKNWFDENTKLGNQIMNTIHSNIQNTTDQFKLLKISVDHVKDQIEECRSECKDVGELKKQIAELKKEVGKLKKSTPERVTDDELYNLEDEYRTNEASSTFPPQLPFGTSQVMPPFNPRLVPPFSVPPNPYQLYGQTLCNLYNHYSQFPQVSTATGAPPLFDPTRSQVNYPSVYPTPDQMYLDMAHLVPSNVPSVPIVPPVPSVQNIPVSVPPTTSANIPKATTKDNKEVPKSLPVNVVITSSDPLPTSTTTPAPVLSVTIPPKHIKGTPHNYQIPMPSTSDSKVIAPPVFTFPFSGNKTNTTTTGSTIAWSSSGQTPFKSTSEVNNSLIMSLNNSKPTADVFGIEQSPNTSLNKSRTLSEKSNTSIENYDPCPDFKPIVPLPAEVKVKTGEEDEMVIFSSRAKLFRFVDKQWKERGLGEMKLLKHKVTGKVRVLMRREQIHKVCANHIISAEMEIKPMINETKAYFWVANDFAEETVILEKFCIRFKTADIGQKFYDAFEKARQECLSSASGEKIIAKDAPLEDKQHTPVKDMTETVTVTNTLGKAVIGGFTFSSTPTFKSLSNSNESDTKPQEAAVSKSNIFSGLALKTTVSSPFSSVFGTPTSQAVTSESQVAEKDVNSKLNVSDTVEEFEPSVDFKPVIPLPALVEQKTGEEDEAILFEHRAKLLRFESSTKEWKERGLGNIKLLVHKDNINKVRLLMRREQIMKVCCNHAVTKDMTFQKMPNVDKAVTWCAKDFSEGELVAETFCLRFKTVQACDDFMDAINSAQLKMKDESKAAKEEQNAAKQSTTGWGDRFKPKAGTWECEQCLVRNDSSNANCSACGSSKDPSTEKPTNLLKNDEPPKFRFGINTQNVANVDPKNVAQVNTSIPAVVTPTNKVATDTSKFSFGIAAQPVNKIEPKSEKNVTTGWGDKFKPKEGSWECKSCFVRNDSTLTNCSACDSPKDPNAVQKDTKSIFDNTNSTSTFRFSMQPVGSNVLSQKTENTTSSIFDGTGTHKFSFGIPSSISESSKPQGAIVEQKPTSIISNSTASDGPINFSLKTDKKEETVQSRLPLLPTPLAGSIKSTPSNEAAVFGFKLTPNPVKAATSSEKSSKNLSDDSDSNSYSNDDDVVTVTSLIANKASVVSEENETALFSDTAKLFRFVDAEWKKRGVGAIKILKNKDTFKVRVAMWNEETTKICLDHLLAPEITYTPKDQKSWLFAAKDCSEGESSLQQFCLRFKNTDAALKFKDTIDQVRSGKASDAGNVDKNDDVIFISETQATVEEKEKAKELMLPENFFTYKNKDPCQGCRGCDSDERKSPPTSNKTENCASAPTFLTPAKTLISMVQSPTSSEYGTPSSFDKTLDAPTFYSPLTEKSSTSVESQAKPVSDNNPKENSVLHNPRFFGGSSELQLTSQAPSSFASGDTQFMTSGKGSLLAPPKLSVLNAPDNKDSAEIKPSTGFGDMKTSFGNTSLGSSSNKSIFDTSSDGQSTNHRSIFGGAPQNTASIFGDGSQGLFGSMAKPSNTGLTQNTLFGGNKLIFGAAQKTEPSFNSPKPDVTSNSDNLVNRKEPMFNVAALSFADLSSTTEGETFQRKANFQWEGAGQQLFSAANKMYPHGSGASNNKSDDPNESGGGDEEYDPHYEPIVPMPEKIVVTTGEEDENKLFGERCKLYRYDDSTREWKERGVGEMKILYHPAKNTYRLLLRREQIHKAVLNMLLFIDLEMLPMMKSDRAWTWVGINYAENPSGVQETLAVRFKSTELANRFHEQVVECVRKLQAATAKALVEETKPDEVKYDTVAPLRLPKNVEDSARADNNFAASVPNLGTSEKTDVAQDSKTDTQSNGTSDAQLQEFLKNVQFREPKEEVDDEQEEDEDYEYDPNDYDAYYNEEEEEDESGAYYTCDGQAVIKHGEEETRCEHARIMVTFDQELYSPKILVADSATGEILTDMLIHTDTEFQMYGDTCMWSGRDFTSNDPADKTVTVNFFDSETAMRFYDSCETSKAATYSSTDPES